MPTAQSQLALTRHPTPTSKPRPSKAKAPLEYGALKKQHPWYDFGPILSHNGVFNFIVTSRGKGKSYGAKKLAIDRWIKGQKQFIYLRRHRDELKSLETFFADIQHLYSAWDFRVYGHTFQAADSATRDEKKRDWFTIGYAMALSTAQSRKSIPYPLVTTIIFDEFIIEKGLVRYLPDEHIVLQNFYNTVDRGQDKTIVLALGNAVSITVPYFLEWDIRPPEGNEPDIKRYRDGFIVAHFDRDQAFMDSVKSTRFGRFIADTEYAHFAVGNEFADNHGRLLGVKSKRASHMFNLETRLGWVSLWMDVMGDTEQYWCLRDTPANQLAFTLVPENMGEDRTLLLYDDKLIRRLRSAFRTGKMTFDRASTRNMFVDVFRKHSGT